MLSYRHSFHAGNFADVLKHSVTVQILKHLILKPKPVYYLDTHSGAGAFTLSSKEAQKNCEYENGIGQLWPQLNELDNCPGLVKDYLETVQQFDPQTKLKTYPGSPWFAQQLLRPQDRLDFFDLHPNESQILRKNFADDKRIHVYPKDGFQACLSQLPPKEKRGYVLMDPPYEIKTDYVKVVETLTKAHKKFANGTYALWYPVVERHRIHALEKAFINSGIRNIQLFELGIAKDGDKGMTASGMIVIQPPWTLMETLQNGLPFLCERLGGRHGHYRAEQLVPE